MLRSRLASSVLWRSRATVRWARAFKFAEKFPKRAIVSRASPKRAVRAPGRASPPTSTVLRVKHLQLAMRRGRQLCLPGRGNASFVGFASRFPPASFSRCAFFQVRSSPPRSAAPTSAHCRCRLRGEQASGVCGSARVSHGSKNSVFVCAVTQQRPVVRLLLRRVLDLTKLPQGIKQPHHLELNNSSAPPTVNSQLEWPHAWHKVPRCLSHRLYSSSVFWTSWDRQTVGRQRRPCFVAIGVTEAICSVSSPVESCSLNMHQIGRPFNGVCLRCKMSFIRWSMFGNRATYCSIAAFVAFRRKKWVRFSALRTRVL